MLIKWFYLKSVVIVQATSDSFQHERPSTAADAEVDSNGQEGPKKHLMLLNNQRRRAWQAHQGEIRIQSLLQ